MESYDWMYYVPIVFFAVIILRFTYIALVRNDPNYVSYSVLPSVGMYAWSTCTMYELWANDFAVAALSWLGITLLPLIAWEIKQFICLLCMRRGSKGGG